MFLCGTRLASSLREDDEWLDEIDWLSRRDGCELEGCLEVEDIAKRGSRVSQTLGRNDFTVVEMVEYLSSS